MIVENVVRAYNLNIEDFVILGDFNIDMKTTDDNKITYLMLQYNLSQFIREPTHVTAHSESIIDLTLVSSINNLLISGVHDTFIENQVRIQILISFEIC